ncbi:CYFA0S18e01794g1_1 [Cyberlindnera fabianii]|uniref:non-specific serine/threonine protein kinase n=1 Tax=Cyberlindnera fabianii TaxID=36022 RepID=A0A061BER7_CYBFA|nr:CYFA0S18e01794g1_1 [Cyberlindnera fabianii]
MSFSQFRFSQLDPLPKIDNVQLGNTIGQGSFAIVKLASLKNQTFAIKFIHRQMCLRRGLSDDEIAREVLLHRHCSGHPNVIKVLHHGADTNWLFIAMELATGGDLFDKIEPDVGVDEVVSQFYFKQMISAIEFCHKQGVAHRDIKPENILLDSRGNLKLTDFGLAAVFMKKSGAKRLCYTPCGSPPYMAPEVVDRNGYDPAKADIWSLGAVLYVLLAGETPWEEPSMHDPDFRKFAESGGKVLSGAWARFSPPVLSLLRLLMRPNVEERGTIDRAMNHIWVVRDNILAAPDGTCKDPMLLTTKLFENLHIGLSDEAFHQSSQAERYDSMVDQNNYPMSQPVADIAAMMDDGDPVDIMLRQLPATQQAYTERSKPRADLSEMENIIKIVSSDPALLQFSTDKKAAIAKLSMDAFQMNSAERLTRFFSVLDLQDLVEILMTSLTRMGVQCSYNFDEENIPDDMKLGTKGSLQISVVLRDRRKMYLRGCIKVSRVQNLRLKKVEFFKTTGDPLEWRRFFKRTTVLSREAVYVDKSEEP